jgi:sedoheptulokinase
MYRLAAGADRELTVDTRFAGTRMTPSARGRIDDIGIDNFTPAALCRGFIRGMVRELTGMIPEDAKAEFSTVLISGNAVRKNPLAQEFITAELGLPCVPALNSEEAATGAALAAAKAADLV